MGSQRVFRPIWTHASHGNVFPFPDNFESKLLKCCSTLDFEASTGNRGTSVHSCFGYERFQDFRVIINF